ncbi:MAG: hypothetical protein AVDCRST_MAG36-1754, partial [uncultured Nocardioidaceae bacterium]
GRRCSPAGTAAGVAPRRSRVGGPGGLRRGAAGRAVGRGGGVAAGRGGRLGRADDASGRLL